MMSNDWDLYEFLGSSAGHSAGGGCGAKDGFLNHDSFSFPYHHDPFDKTFHRQSPGHPIASPSAAAGGLGEKLPHFLSLHQRQLQMLKDHNEKHRIGFQALAARLRRCMLYCLENLNYENKSDLILISWVNCPIYCLFLQEGADHTGGEAEGQDASEGFLVMAEVRAEANKRLPTSEVSLFSSFISLLPVPVSRVLRSVFLFSSCLFPFFFLHL